MNKIDTIKTELDTILNFIGIKPEVEFEEDGDYIYIDITGDDLNFLIGYRGQSLDALQVLMNQIIFNKLEERTPVVIDINNYKNKRSDKLMEITKNYIDKARFFDTEVDMPPMKAWERRQVHMFVSEYDDIESHSEGEGRDRHIVLSFTGSTGTNKSSGTIELENESSEIEDSEKIMDTNKQE